MSRVVASRNLIKSTPFRRFPFAGGCIGRSYCRWRCSVADKHSVETVKKLLEAAKPRKFKESVELAVNLRVVLGPRGKMPRPVPPTADPTNLITAMRNTVRVRSRDKPTFHAALGTRDMPPEDLAENLDAVMRRLIGKLERGRFNIRSAYLKTTMGPAVKYL